MGSLSFGTKGTTFCLVGQKEFDMEYPHKGDCDKENHSVAHLKSHSLLKSEHLHHGLYKS